MDVIIVYRIISWIVMCIIFQIISTAVYTDLTPNLLFHGTKPLPEPMSTYHLFCSTHREVSSHEVLVNLINDICLKIMF